MRLPVSPEGSHHEEERGAHGAEELGSVGGDGLDSSAPGQRVEPRLADHIQVSGDVHCCVLAAHKSNTTHRNVDTG